MANFALAFEQIKQVFGQVRIFSGLDWVYSSKNASGCVFGYPTHHYFQQLHLPKLYFTMVYVVFICNVLYFQCLSMDSIGYYYKYFGKILPSRDHLCVMDFHDLYGNLYPIDISGYLVFAEKSKYILFNVYV